MSGLLYHSKIMIRINEQAPVWYSGGTPTLIAADEAIRSVNDWTMPSGNLDNGMPGAVTFLTEIFIADQ